MITGELTQLIDDKGNPYFPIVSTEGLYTKDGLKTVDKKFEEIDSALDNISTILPYVNAKSFGAKGDGVTDDTVALKNFFKYIFENSRKGFLPNGVYLISSEIEITNEYYGWSLIGESKKFTIIRQITDDISIFKFNNNRIRDIYISDLTLEHKNAQTNINGSSIVLGNYIYESTFERIEFNSYYGVYVPNGVISFWGCSFDDITFRGTGGCIKMGDINAIPNNVFGRLYVIANNMTQTLFVMRGYNSSFNCVEILNATNVTLFEVQSESVFSINSIKIESSTFTTGNMFKLINGATIFVDSVSLSGDFTNCSYFSGTMGTGTKMPIFTVNYVNEDNRNSSATNVFVASGSIKATIGFISSTDNFATSKLTAYAGNSYVDYTTYLDIINNKTTEILADDFTLNPKLANNYFMKTLLTKDIIITIPNGTFDICSNLRYQIVCGDIFTNGFNIKIYCLAGSTNVLIGTISQKGTYSISWNKPPSGGTYPARGYFMY